MHTRKTERQTDREREPARKGWWEIFLYDVFLLDEHIQMQFFNTTEETANVSAQTQIVKVGFLDGLLVLVQRNCLRDTESEATNDNWLFIICIVYIQETLVQVYGLNVEEEFSFPNTI